MKRAIPFVVLSVCLAALVVPLAAQAPGRLLMFADMALFSGNGMPRNCFVAEWKPFPNVASHLTIVNE